MATVTILCPKTCIKEVHEFFTRAGYGAPRTVATAVLGAQLEITREQLPTARELHRELNKIRKARGSIRVLTGTTPVYPTDAAFGVKRVMEGGAE